MTETPRPWFAYFIPPPTLALSFVIVALFAYGYVNNPSDADLKSAVIGSLMLAVGYWLGSSKGAVDNRDQLNKTQDKLAETAAAVAVAAVPAHGANGAVSLAPGESVRVDAAADEPEDPAMYGGPRP